MELKVYKSIERIGFKEVFYWYAFVKPDSSDPVLIIQHYHGRNLVKTVYCWAASLADAASLCPNKFNWFESSFLDLLICTLLTKSDILPRYTKLQQTGVP